MKPTTTKRFIAGAVCPGCGGVDKIKAWRDGEVQFRECVACGFSDRASGSEGEPIATRLDRPAAGTGQAMTFYPRKAEKKRSD